MDRISGGESKTSGKLIRLPRPDEKTEELEGTESWLSTESPPGLREKQRDDSI